MDGCIGGCICGWMDRWMDESFDGRGFCPVLKHLWNGKPVHKMLQNTVYDNYSFNYIYMHIM